jgi:hypothetical protein
VALDEVLADRRRVARAQRLGHALTRRHRIELRRDLARQIEACRLHVIDPLAAAAAGRAQIHRAIACRRLRSGGFVRRGRGLSVQDAAPRERSGKSNDTGSGSMSHL